MGAGILMDCSSKSSLGKNRVEFNRTNQTSSMEKLIRFESIDIPMKIHYSRIPKKKGTEKTYNYNVMPT